MVRKRSYRDTVSRLGALVLMIGFLSENEAFAEKVAAAGLTWVGPSAEVIRKFGLKHTARELAVQSGVSGNHTGNVDARCRSFKEPTCYHQQKTPWSRPTRLAIQ